MSRGTRIALVMGSVMLLAAWMAAAAERPTASKAGSQPAIATVGSRSISRQEFEQRLKLAQREYRRRRGAAVPAQFEAIFERQILEAMIRAQLSILEAQRRGIQVSDADAEAELRHDPYFQTDGHFDSAKLTAAKIRYPAAYQDAIRKARLQAAGRRLNEQITAEKQPDEREIRKKLEHEMTRASVEFLAIHRSDFSGDYPEPRETAILDYYRHHAREFRRPAAATLSVILVSDPGPPTGDDEALSEWSDEMKAHADSVLRALAGGALFDDLGDAWGGVHGDIEVTPGQFPAFWKGDSAIDRDIFTLAAGRVYPRPIPADPGWLVVRVDRARPEHPASLAEAAPEIRARLRADARRHSLERVLRADYQQRRATLRGPAFRIRYAQVSLAALDPGTPTADDLSRFYRGHLADYTSYDAASASVVSKAFEQVKNDVERRWREEEKAILLRDWTQRLEDAWSQGRRDKELERMAGQVHEVGPIPCGAVVDTGEVGRALTHELNRRGCGQGAGDVPLPTSSVVYQVYESISDYQPTFEQIFPIMAKQYQEHEAEVREQKAHEMFDRDPQRFALGRVLHLTRVISVPMDPIQVPLTRREVERYHREHLDRYSAPEMVRARHILVAPRDSSAEADAAARRRAEELLRRVRAGEDFAMLAHQYSDDPGSRDRGGDLGYFPRGKMLEAVEHAAFSLKPGEVSDLVKSSLGYHIIEVEDHLPLMAPPLAQVYTMVGGDAALEKSQRISKETMDSLALVVKTPKEALAAAQKLKLVVMHYRHVIGNRNYPSEQIPSFVELEKLPMGTLYPGPLTVKHVGSFLQWPDSVSAPQTPTWETARKRVLAAYDREVGREAFEAKRAEIDSLLGSGWSVDSVAALWGGFVRASRVRPGRGLPSIGGDATVDSLLFGDHPVLADGETSGWLEFPTALVRLRLVARRPPDPETLANRVDLQRHLRLERNLSEFFDGLKRRFPVRIHDRRLAGVTLPTQPESPRL